MSEALVMELLAFALRATVLLFGAWAATKLLRQASAATRHLIWTSAIAGVLALPFLTFLVPAWNVPVVSIAATADAPLEPITSIASSSVAPTQTGAAQNTTPLPAPAASIAVARADAAGITEALSSLVNGRDVIAIAWLFFAVVMLARLAVANARVSSWHRSSRPVEDGRWHTLLRRLTREYGIERPVVLLEHGQTDVPVTWGIVYPVILLPASAEDWDEEQRVAVLTHELAHVKRFDALSQLLGQLALALLWFHPMVWMAVRRMRLEREHACDDFVLIAGARASRYADDLLSFARRLTRPTAPAAAALAMARRSELEGRLLAILDPAMKRTAVRRARVALLTLAVMVLATPLAAFRPAARVTTLPAAVASARNDAQPTPVADSAPSARPSTFVPKVKNADIDRQTPELESLFKRIGISSTPTLEGISRVPSLDQLRDTIPPVPIELETLISVTRAAKRMSSDYDKGQLLNLIVKRYQPSDTLREAYLDVVFSMSSDYDRSKALVALLDRDSIPTASTARVLRSAKLMSSDNSRALVLKRISPVTFADTAIQAAYLDVIVAMSSNTERASAISSLVKQRPLSPTVQSGLMRAIGLMSSNTEKANMLLLFVEHQGLADQAVRRAFFKTAESLSADYDYRRVIAAVVR
jgi:beta-lactamase regulating signal transducer with metallopeptidase domain